MDDSLETAKAGCPSDLQQIGRAPKCQGCPGQALCQQTAKENPDQKTIDLRMKPIRHKIMVLSGKGGVGKSTVASLLATSLAMQGFKVGILDLDICGPSVPHLMHVEDKQITNSPYGWIPLTNPDDIKVMSVGFLLQQEDNAVIWRGPRKTAMISRFLKETFWGKLDYLLFDTPPGTSDEHLTVVKCLKNANPDGAIIVTTPQDVALATIKKEIQFCQKLHINILGILENMSGFACPCCEETYDLFHNKQVEEFCIEKNVNYLGKLPIRMDISQWCDGETNRRPDNVIDSMKCIFSKLNISK